MNCILFRHGIAVSCEDWNGPESERPLTKEGLNKTRKAVEGLYQIEGNLTHLLSSPFKRALETAQILQEVYAFSPKIQVCQELLFDHSPTDILPVLTILPQDSCVICVGHEPHLGQLAAHMVSGRNIPGFSLKKAGACAIQFEEKPRMGQGGLKWWLPPAQLRQLRNT